MFAWFLLCFAILFCFGGLLSCCDLLVVLLLFGIFGLYWLVWLIFYCLCASFAFCLCGVCGLDCVALRLKPACVSAGLVSAICCLLCCGFGFVVLICLVILCSLLYFDFAVFVDGFCVAYCFVLYCIGCLNVFVFCWYCAYVCLLRVGCLLSGCVLWFVWFGLFGCDSLFCWVFGFDFGYGFVWFVWALVGLLFVILRLFICWFDLICFAVWFAV